MRNELTEPDEGVSVESQPIKDLRAFCRLACVAWEEQEVPGTNLHVAAACCGGGCRFSPDPLVGSSRRLQ